MPQHKSCKKRLKTSELSRIRNRGVRSAVRNSLKAVSESKSFEEASKALNAAVAALDRAAGKSLIHKNMAARKKSRLYAQVARLKN